MPSSYRRYEGERHRNYLDFRIGPLPCRTGITLRTCPKERCVKITLYTPPGEVAEFVSMLYPHADAITQVVQSDNRTKIQFIPELKSGTTLVIRADIEIDRNQIFEWFVNTAIKLYTVLKEELA